MRLGAEIARRLGFATTLDDNPPTFAADFPMSQIAFYSGWYDVNASGPFTQPKIEFMPGAFAYHLHSYSAATLRSKTEHWVGPFLAAGATISMGSVTEPYLTGTPNIAAFLEHFGFRKFSFGEAAYTCQPSLSWQTTAVGDPLYRPFGQRPDALHFKLEQTKSPLLEWSHARVVDLNEANGMGPDDLLKYLEQIPITARSAVLTEKRGDLQRKKNALEVACAAYGAALKLKPSPQQKIRLLLNLGELQTQLGQHQAALDAYKQLIKDVPDYPGAAAIYQHLASLADKLGRKSDAEKYAAESRRLSAAPK
jgi:tetratricopeptide (TPR) repeat protein